MIRPVAEKARITGATESARPSGAPGRKFSLDLPVAAEHAASAGGPLLPSEAPRFLESLSKRREEIDNMIQRSLRGQTLSPQQLLVWQARVYDYSQRMELFSRVVDKTVSAVKTTLNTQT